MFREVRRLFPAWAYTQRGVYRSGARFIIIQPTEGPAVVATGATLELLKARLEHEVYLTLGRRRLGRDYPPLGLYPSQKRRQQGS